MSSPVPRDDYPERQSGSEQGEAAGESDPGPEPAPRSEGDDDASGAERGDQGEDDQPGDGSASFTLNLSPDVFPQAGDRGRGEREPGYGADSSPRAAGPSGGGDGDERHRPDGLTAGAGASLSAGATPEVELGRPEARSEGRSGWSQSQPARTASTGGKLEADHPDGPSGDGEGLTSGPAFSPVEGSGASATGETSPPRTAPEVELGRPEVPPRTAPEVELGRPEVPPPRAKAAGTDVAGPDAEQDSTGSTGSPSPTGSAVSGAASAGAASAGAASAGAASAGAAGAGAAGAGAAGAAAQLADDATQRLDRGDDSVEARQPSAPSRGARQEDETARQSGRARREDDTATMSPPRAERTRPARPARTGGATAPQPPRTRPTRSPAPGGARPTPRRHAMVRRVDPWSVLKLSLVFYFCILLVVMLGLTVFWTVVNQLGIIDQLLGFLEDLQFVVSIDGGMIARAIFLIGLLNVVLWSGINVFLAFLYNLVADLVGGLRVTLAEDQPD